MFVKPLLSAAVVLFWGVMNFLLLQRQFAAPAPILYVSGPAAITEASDEWWGIYYQGEKIGYGRERIAPEGGGYRIEDFSLMRLQLLGAPQTVQVRLSTAAASDWTLREFTFSLDSTDVRFAARGKVEGQKLRLAVDSGGERVEKELALKQPPYLQAALRPYLATQSMEPGKENLFSVFDPSTLSQQTTTVIVEGREWIKIQGKTEPALRVRQRFQGISVVSWLDRQGRTLKEESVGGFALIREGPEEATRLSQSRSVPLDLIVRAAVPVPTPIQKPEKKEFIRLRLSGFDLDHFPLSGGRQQLTGDVLEIQREDLRGLRSYRIPNREARFAPYLQSTPFLQSDHPRIRALVERVLGGESDASRAIVRIKDWVYREIKKEPTVSIPSALEVLRTKKGDCNEHTVLFNAMARAAGIPAKTVVGVTYVRDAFYYHAWSEVWLGEWVSVDSVLNQFPADVTHVRFLEGEIDRQIDILQLVGKIKIEPVEAS